MLLCARLWPLLWSFGVWKVNTKAPALMTVWSAARGAGRLSKWGHSFCLRSLSGPIQPPTPLQHPLSARFPRRRVKGGGGLSLSLPPSLWPFVTRQRCRERRVIEAAAPIKSYY